MFDTQSSTTTSGSYEIKVHRTMWPDRQWYYQVKEGYSVSSGGPFGTQQEAQRAADRKVAELRNGKLAG